MVVLYPNPCYNNVCYKGITLYMCIIMSMLENQYRNVCYLLSESLLQILKLYVCLSITTVKPVLSSH